MTNVPDLESNLPQYQPKYTEEWTHDQQELVMDIMEIARDNAAREKKLAATGYQFFPWMNVAIHGKALLAMLCENEGGTVNPARGNEVVGDIQETKLLVFRWYYQRCTTDEIKQAEAAAVRQTLLAGRNGPPLPPPPGQ